MSRITALLLPLLLAVVLFQADYLFAIGLLTRAAPYKHHLLILAALLAAFIAFQTVRLLIGQRNQPTGSSTPSKVRRVYLNAQQFAAQRKMLTELEVKKLQAHPQYKEWKKRAERRSVPGKETDPQEDEEFKQLEKAIFQ